MKITFVPKGTIKLPNGFKHRDEVAADYMKNDPATKLPRGAQATLQNSTRKQTYSIRLDPADIARIEAEAERRGIGPRTLIRMYVHEQVQNI